MKRISLFVAFLWLGIMGASAQGSRYDVNGDGRVNVTDALSIVNKVLNGTNADGNTPAEAIDLGLPSGTKWASYNLGASTPEECGGRYAWGEVEEKLVYSLHTYINWDRSTGSILSIGDDICGTVYDAAHVKWGGSWHMPSQADFEELVTYCTYEWTTLNGVKGGKITGRNGNSIFLPVNSAFEWNDGVYWLGYDDGNGVFYGYYGDQSNWFANCLRFDEYEFYGDNIYREDGLMIRPVYSNISKTKMVDLGLPSGTKWATCNVGASCPEEKGDLYAWGETGTKLEYTWDNYLYYDSLKLVTEYGESWEEVVCRNIGNDISGTKYDVAHVKWGGIWRMPTKDEMNELFHNCKRNGNLFTGPNGNSIIFPLNANYWTSTMVTDEYSDGNYRAYITYYDNVLPGDEFLFIMEGDRCEGGAIRPVYSPSSPLTSGDCIDLGLPSGTKWASCNVGATKPEEYGGYYAWGETEEKDNYTWSTYTLCDGSYKTCYDIGSISGTEYDVAHVKLGGKWRIPTVEQINELYSNCVVDWVTINGVNGRKFCSKINGNSIFLPAAGYRSYNSFVGVGSQGKYWLSTQSSSLQYSHDLEIDSDGVHYNFSNLRYCGQSIRPVQK